MNLIEWPYYRTEFLASQGLSPTFLKRFWSKVRIGDGCWEWTASRHGWGYGQIGRWKQSDPPVLAHVASWIIHFGTIPEGMWVLHNCDNPPCIRPDHLKLGGPKENTADMMARGRQVIGKRYFGSENQNSKLTFSQVELIRAAYRSGKTQRRIAEIFQVSQTLISAIVLHKIWNQPQTRP